MPITSAETAPGKSWSLAKHRCCSPTVTSKVSSFAHAMSRMTSWTSSHGTEASVASPFFRSTWPFDERMRRWSGYWIIFLHREPNRMGPRRSWLLLRWYCFCDTRPRRRSMLSCIDAGYSIVVQPKNSRVKSSERMYCDYGRESKQ